MQDSIALSHTAERSQLERNPAPVRRDREFVPAQARFSTESKEGPMKFIHRFSRTLSCEMTVVDGPPAAGEAHILTVEWTSRPKRKHTREYVRWCHVVNEHLANLWALKLMHAVQVGPRLWELWGYEPGRPAKLLDKVRDR